jgi:hypothetical protein
MKIGKIFNTQEVQAILKGNKTMFRKVIKKPRHETLQDCIFKGQLKVKGFQVYFENPRARWLGTDMPTGITIKCPYQVGQKIFVKEKFKERRDGIYYDGTPFREEYLKVSPWSLPQHMRQEHSRLTLQIKEIRVEKLSEISEEDAIAEGVERGIANGEQCGYKDYKDSFKTLWNATHKKPEEKFEANCWCWVVDFEVEND